MMAVEIELQKSWKHGSFDEEGLMFVTLSAHCVGLMGPFI